MLDQRQKDLMYRFFEEKADFSGDRIRLNKENSHHLTKVLRIGENEDFELVIASRVYTVRAAFIEEGHLYVDVLDERDDDNESKLKIRVFQGLPKGDKLELIIQKVIELGAYEVIAFESERTVVKWDNKKAVKKLERYGEIAQAAAKQAKRGFIPKVRGLLSFDQLLEEVSKGFTVLAYENYGTALSTALADHSGEYINIVIGPEGGFSEKEVERLRDKGAKTVHLGKRIMRTETCAIALTAILQYELGDLDEKI